MPNLEGTSVKENFIHVLGSADWHQTKFNDHSCYTVDHRLMVDCCPSVVTQLQEAGVDPLNVPILCFTHMHCDHYMGLAPLLHYWRVCMRTKLGGLTIVGPKANVREVVMRTLDFVFGEQLFSCVTEMPRIVELEGNAQMEAEGYTIEVMNSDHTVPGLCYRITDKATGHAVGFTGDTAYIPTFAEFFHRVDLLVHEASYGGTRTDAVNSSRHSSAHEAVAVCRASGARKLLLTHAYEPKREAALAVASAADLDVPVAWAMPCHDYFY